MLKKVMLTGDRPTGPLHLGHYVGSLKSRKEIQDTLQYDMFILLADVQALTDYYDRPDYVRGAIVEVVKDYLSVGINPEKVNIFVQSQVRGLPELTQYFMNLVPMPRLGRNPTVKAEIQQKGMGENVTAGFYCYPVAQAADILAFSYGAEEICVPVGEDQVPMIEQCNEIGRKFNTIYGGECFKEAKAYLSSYGRLVGIDGKEKAGKSLNNAIFLSDTDSALKAKIDAMYTDPDHIHVHQPGKVEGNVVFAYLDAFYQDKEILEDMKRHYTRGGLGDVTVKKTLYTCLAPFIAAIREKRSTISTNYVHDVIHQGTIAACRRVEMLMDDVRSRMCLYGAS